jgi:hypothetical protein
MPPNPTITKMPLSGDVLQTINPWTWWNTAVNQLGGQFGLININTMASGNPVLENEIVQNVASYGKQLGRITEVLNVLIAKDLTLSDLNPKEQQTITAFQDMVAKIDAAKDNRTPTLSTTETDRFLNHLMALKQTNPTHYNTLRAQIMARIQGEGL